MINDHGAKRERKDGAVGSCEERAGSVSVIAIDHPDVTVITRQTTCLDFYANRAIQIRENHTLRPNKNVQILGVKMGILDGF